MRFSIIFLFAAMTTAHASLLSSEIEGLTFDQFTSKYSLKYSADETGKREALFLAELARVQSHNAAKKGWTETINRFSAMTAAEKKASLGYHKGAKQAFLSSPARQHAAEALHNSNLPTNVDWRQSGIVTAVKGAPFLPFSNPPRAMQLPTCIVLALPVCAPLQTLFKPSLSWGVFLYKCPLQIYSRRLPPPPHQTKATADHAGPSPQRPPSRAPWPRPQACFTTSACSRWGLTLTLILP